MQLPQAPNAMPPDSRQLVSLDLNERYRSLLARTDVMLGLAREQCWDELIDEGVGYLIQLEAVMEADIAIEEAFAVRLERRELVAKIIANDAEIRNYLRLRREELRGLMRHTDASKRAGIAYQRFQE